MKHPEEVTGDQWSRVVIAILPLSQLPLACTYECLVLIFLYLTYLIK